MTTSHDMVTSTTVAMLPGTSAGMRTPWSTDPNASYVGSSSSSMRPSNSLEAVLGFDTDILPAVSEFKGPLDELQSTSP